MRINPVFSSCSHYPDEMDHGIATVQRRQQFQSLLRHSTPDGSSQEEETALMRRQRLEGCFMTLLQGGKMYRDSRIQVKRIGTGKLHWRLLSGPLEGCTLYVCWDANAITIDFNAPSALAERLTGIRETLQQHLNSTQLSRSITVKVTRESGFS